VTSERNILGTQLIRRNEELALLYEKIKIQESTLKKGEVQYKARLEEIKKQKDGIATLKTELFVTQQQAESIDDLKKEVYHLQRELLQERTKVKALSEELENPMNVHRWRKLEGSDPAMYELIQKVRTLQKRLIVKTEEVVAKDLEIQEKDRLHKDLTHILEKQPGPEVMEHLEMYQDTFAAKLKQMKEMQSELKTYQAQVADYTASPPSPLYRRWLQPGALGRQDTARRRCVTCVLDGFHLQFHRCLMAERGPTRKRGDVMQGPVPFAASVLLTEV